MTEGQKQTKIKLKDMNLQTGKAYRLKLALQDMWTYPTIYADL
ncbi:transposase [Paenibacillus sp. CECT 9249]|nr:transposase [Paenibacillus sp. CECT 9249]